MMPRMVSFSDALGVAAPRGAQMVNLRLDEVVDTMLPRGPAPCRKDQRRFQPAQADAAIPTRETWLPTPRDLEVVVESLHVDEVWPHGRIVRKRILEMSEARAGQRCLDVSLPTLRRLCEASPAIYIEEDEATSIWAALLVGRPKKFVDIESPIDEYTEEMWQQLEVHLRGLGSNTTLPGGRFACAQKLVREELPCLANFSLGRVCHIVQLAISTRRLLAYRHGRLAWCDPNTGKPGALLPSKVAGRWQLPQVTWPSLMIGLQCLFRTAPHADGHVPLSNLRRLFRTQFGLELDEAALGCTKLSELFEQDFMQGLCVLHRHKSGILIVPGEFAMLEAPDVSSMLSPEAVAGTCRRHVGGSEDSDEDEKRAAEWDEWLVDPSRVALRLANTEVYQCYAV